MTNDSWSVYIHYLHFSRFVCLHKKFLSCTIITKIITMRIWRVSEEENLLFVSTVSWYSVFGWWRWNTWKWHNFYYFMCWTKVTQYILLQTNIIDLFLWLEYEIHIILFCETFTHKYTKTHMNRGKQKTVNDLTCIRKLDRERRARLFIFNYVVWSIILTGLLHHFYHVWIWIIKFCVIFVCEFMRICLY